MAVRSLLRKASSVKPVCLDYADLVSNKDLSKEIEEAYSNSGLGVLTVKNIPNYPEKRKTLLPLARKLALLSDTEKAELEQPQHKFSVGWSHGKEHYGGLADFSKGSFYANPEVDQAPAKGEWPDNVWPKRSLPELEGAFKDIGKTAVHVGTQLAKHLDLFISSRVKTYTPNTLETIIATHKSHVGRLLHYFPQVGSTNNWCGWHNDHGALTALTSSLYLDQKTGQVISANEIGDVNVGLFVRNRKGEKIKVQADADHLCFQIGESAQILSGGILQATPHAVLTEGKLENISRNTFAIFMEPRGFYIMNSHDEKSIYIEHEGVPSLKNRWKQGIRFLDFHLNTIGAFN